MPIYAFLRLLSHDISIWGDSFLFWTKSRVLLSLEQLLHPIQYTACKKCQCNSKDKLVLPSVTGILSTSDQLHYLWGTSCFGDGTRQCWGFPYQLWCLNMLFVCIFRMSILGRNYFSWFNLFSFWCVLKYHFQAANWCLYTLFSGYCHVLFPYEEIFFLFWTKSRVLFSLEQLLHPIQCPAWKKCFSFFRKRFFRKRILGRKYFTGISLFSLWYLLQVFYS